MPRQDKLKSRELLLLAEQKPEKGDKYNKDGWRLRVVQWYGVNKKGDVWQSTKLERRRFYLDDDDTPRMGKAEGLGLDDMKIVKEKWSEVIAMLKNPPKIEEEQQQSESDDNLDDVPF